ncbi:hypothetical protein B566_EDAN005863 [Ephemera danica]|nr:hypothetical protein B566_EDAN005863 [Ephemera danica]
MMDSLLCGFVFWLVGYTLAFGDGNSFLGIHYYQGGKDMFSKKQYAHFFFQLSYASTPSTIVSGAVVDRISFIAYVTYSAFISGVLYPIVCHWVWHPEGWLVHLGFKDFCGSSALHLVGGSCAIAAAVILGPRINRFPKPGYQRTPEEELRFSHHNAVVSYLFSFVTHQIVDIFSLLDRMILYTGFFAFNGGSVLHITKLGDGEMLGKIMIITWLASSGGAFGTLLWFRLGLVDGNPRWSLLNALNAGLSGMVLTEKLKIDDPIDVIAVHFGGGLWGTVGNSMLRHDSFVGGYGYQGGWYLAYQIAGALTIMLWSAGLSAVLFGSLRYLGLLRVSPEDELRVKHKEQSYQGIMCICDYMQKKHDISATELRGTHHGLSNPPSYNTSTLSLSPDIGEQLQHGLSHRHVSDVRL